MKKSITICITLLLSMSFAIPNLMAAQLAGENLPVSGKIIGGYRVIPILPTPEPVRLTVYRGDYLKFALAPTVTNPLLSIPSLSIEARLERDLEKTPYFKMKHTGRYPFTLGEIAVIGFSRPQYTELTAQEASIFIKNTQPLVLDVRTPGEFKRGHLPDARLLPVQQLQKRVGELAAFKNENILVYCATGNRSTVASKILIDSGFQRLFNLRYGYADWKKRKHPTRK